MLIAVLPHIYSIERCWAALSSKCSALSPADYWDLCLRWIKDDLSIGLWKFTISLGNSSLHFPVERKEWWNPSKFSTPMNFFFHFTEKFKLGWKGEMQLLPHPFAKQSRWNGTKSAGGRHTVSICKSNTNASVNSTMAYELKIDIKPQPFQPYLGR